MKLGKKLSLSLFFGWIFIKLMITGYIIYLLWLYIFPLSYTLLNIKIKYPLMIGVTLLMAKYWQRFIKRKLHFLLEGDNKI